MTNATKTRREFPHLLDMSTVAEKLGVGVATVRRLCLPDKETGAVEIPSIMIGGQRKISEHDLWVYLRQKRQQSINAARRRERSTETVVPVQAGDSVHIGDTDAEGDQANAGEPSSPFRP